MGADAAAGTPRLLRWGAHLLLLGAIAVLFVNSSPFLAEPWQDVLLLALAPLVVAAVLLRDRLPYALPALGILALAGGTVAVAMVGIATMAIRRSGPAAWLLVGAAAASLTALTVARELESGPVGIAIAVGIGLVMVVLAPVAIGRYIRAHDRLEASAAEASARAEIERELAARDAAHAERERIAREMHDGLGHALALIAMQAGAIEVRSREPESAAAAERIRETARTGLADLRAVVHALGEEDRRDPVPGLADVPALVAASRAAGAEVRLDDRIAAADHALLAPSLGRLVHGIVQEGLTNAHRHAPGAPVEVALSGAPGEGLVVAVENPLAPGGEGGAGTGLATLRERVAMLGGELDARAARGRFALRAALPWEAGS